MLGGEPGRAGRCFGFVERIVHMERFYTRRQALAMLTAAFGSALVLGGCSAAPGDGGTDGAAGQPIAEDGQSGAEGPFATADLMGTIVKSGESGIVLRPGKTTDEMAVVGLEDEGEDRELDYAGDCEFTVARGDAATGALDEQPGSADDVKVDCTACVWLDAGGDIEKLSVFYAE